MRSLMTGLALVALLLSGCGSADDGAPTSEPSTSSASGDTLLERHDLAGLSGAEVVDTLDRLPLDDRPADLMASVKPDQLILTSGDEELALPTPDGEFYLSVAPYVDQTHDCFHHSLTTCKGELGGEEVKVTITDDTNGEVLVDDTVTTFENGFAGFWLPRDIEGTLTVEYDDKQATTEFATGAEDPTCLTTVRLA
ncbi:CueP family metal-binding protein [Nocardioides seonyuensis]|nr:CueP family metal-binding protein [Nocardioides seonyuensis]